jgi:hypothetical protein
MNVAEEITAFRLKRRALIERREAIVNAVMGEHRTRTAEEISEDEDIEAKVESIDAHLKYLDKREADDLGTGKAVSMTRGPLILERKHSDADPAFQGQMFVRKAIATALAKLEDYARPAHQIAQERWGKQCPMLVKVIKSGVKSDRIVTKAGVPGGGDGSGEWGAELVQMDGRYMGDFLEYLWAITVFDRLTLRAVPANVTIKGQDGASTAFWVGQSKSIPATTGDFSAVSLTPLKVAALTSCSNELLRDSSPAAEQLIRDSLAQASAERVDLTFLSTAPAVAGVSPAGILNGVTALGSNGQDGAAVREDLRELYAPFINANIPTTGLALVMHPNLAASLSLMPNALGLDEFPDITPEGGTLRSIQVVTGSNVGQTHMIMLKPAEIWKIGDSGIEITLSREATIEQDSAPTGASDTPTAATATLVSMFGTESTAFKVVRSINWQKRRAQAAQWMSDALYGQST